MEGGRQLSSLSSHVPKRGHESITVPSIPRVAHPLTGPWEQDIYPQNHTFSTSTFCDASYLSVPKKGPASEAPLARGNCGLRSLLKGTLRCWAQDTAPPAAVSFTTPVCWTQTMWRS